MLLASLPHTFVLTPIRPGEVTKSVSLAALVVALIALTIWPCEVTLAVHQVVPPLTAVDSTIGPLESATPLDDVGVDLAHVVATILPLDDANSVLSSEHESSFIEGSVSPDFLAISLLHVIDPIANVAGPICVKIGASAMSLITDEVTPVSFSIGMDQSTVATCLVIDPHALVLGAVLPDLDADSFTDTVLSPHSFESSTTIQFIGLPFY